MSLSVTMTAISLLFLLVLFTLNYHSQADLVADTCKKVDYPDLCLSTLRSNPRSKSADLKELARITFDAALAKSTNTLNQIMLLLKKTKDPIVKKYLTTCATLYGDAVDYIPQAIRFVGSDNFQAKLYGGVVIDNALDCEDAFTTGELGKRKSPLTASNNVMKELVVNALTIVDFLG
ncbi:hypothetical protein Acr_17g0000680 [Actinidia rufa]|uniref:Pectinesterase inhibitor domain-containing protein n=1 Tax=Actinidia rufa TaxID=165716 RepID=A0A7J0G0P0_9ERIC|nr:hypothetical protein Acr_17g0000680 [Actinidia rufa]